jgi:hypothetical protein
MGENTGNVSISGVVCPLDDYANPFLTVSSDKLPAISGLAREIQIHTSATYKAGIWLEDDYRGLLWSYFDSGRRIDPYRAPSWSWAAMDALRAENHRFTHDPYY